MNDVLCLIPARGGSKRIPRKNLVDLCGKPLIAWTIECALRADVGPVWVSTEDEEIAEVASKWGARVHERCPAASGAQSTADAVVCDFDGYEDRGWFLYLQPTSPLRTVGVVRELARHARLGVSALCAVRHPVFSDEYREPGWVDCGAGYAVRSWSWLGRDSFERFDAVIPIDPCEAIDVDYPHDLAAAEAAMRERGMA